MISDKLKIQLLGYIEKHLEVELLCEMCAPKCCSDIEIDLNPSFSETLLDDNGNINTLEKGGVIKAPVSQANVTSLTLKITGFTKEEHKDVKLVLGAYVIVTEADATTVSYLQVTKPAEGYSYITYNEISA